MQLKSDPFCSSYNVHSGYLKVLQFQMNKNCLIHQNTAVLIFVGFRLTICRPENYYFKNKKFLPGTEFVSGSPSSEH